MGMERNILGVSFKNNPNMVEHQWFPVEYFSGSDVTIYIGDIFLSEVTALSFTLTEKVLPIFGYASKTFDHASRGSRLVEGIIQIPFVEAGYLESILSHVGKYTTENEKAKPKLAYTKAGEKAPGWVSNLKMDIEGYIVHEKFYQGSTGFDVGIELEMPNGDKEEYQRPKDGLGFVGGAGLGNVDLSKKSHYNERVEKYEREVWGRDKSKDRDRRYQHYFYEDRAREDGKNTQEILKKTGFDIYITYGPQAEAEKYAAGGNASAPAMQVYTFGTTVKAIRNIQLTSSGQTITADGRPVYEQYSFIAMDLD